MAGAAAARVANEIQANYFFNCGFRTCFGSEIVQYVVFKQIREI